MSKRKSKRGSTADFEFSERTFLDGVPSADAADAARYRWLISPACGLAFLAELVYVDTGEWDRIIDERRIK